MDYIWVPVAFICGFLAKQINLPPLIGYLIAGFGLHALGVEPDASLQALADLGVTLLLFTIGLKLDFKSLFKLEIWGSASGHMGTIVCISALNCLIYGSLGVAHFVGLNWSAGALIGFALSFSSTVFAVKVLEEKGELQTHHGQVAIGILIIQDIAAVIFVTLATDKSPSWWALILFALPLIRPALIKLIQYCGHAELLPLAGFFLAYSGGELFELFGLKAQFGALVIGILLSSQAKATELAKSLINFKDLFLIGFFLSIGFTALPTIDMLGAALILAIAIPFKAALFFLWLTQLRQRSRSAFLAALSLANYSEFGLIVCAASVSHGLLEKEWLVIMALAVALSFIFSSIINANAHRLYTRWSHLIKRFERSELSSEDPISPLSLSKLNNASVLVIGMGRVGAGAYDTLNDKAHTVCGIDVSKERVEAHSHMGRQVIPADAEDPEFWACINLDAIRLIMLAMPKHADILEVARQLKVAGYQGKSAGIIRFEDEKKDLLEAGIDVVFNHYEKAGTGFANKSIYLLDND